MDDEELEQSGQENNNRTGGRFNPATKVANSAQNVQNVANTASKVAEKSSQKAAQKAIQQTGKKSAKSTAKAASRNKMSQNFAKIGAKAGKVANIATKLAGIMATIGLIIIILIAIIGILVFIITGFGFIMQGLQQIVDGIGGWWTSWTEGAEHIVKEEQILDTLNYLEEMEYDLFGYGFTTVEDPITVTTEDADDEDEEPVEKKKLTYDSDDPAYDYIRTYLISDNYATIIKNSNKNLKEMFSSFSNFLPSCWGGTNWGSGLISIYHEGSGGIGTKGKDSNTSRIGKDLATVEDGKLKITKTRLSSTSWEYDLDGWIGRYSMPLEFLLATHVATMAPDLSLRLATSFDTDVEVLLHKSTGGTVKSGIVSKDANLSTISDDQVLTAKDFAAFYEIIKAWYKKYFNWLPTWMMDMLEEGAELEGKLVIMINDTTAMQIYRIANQKGIDFVSPDSCQGPETEEEDIQKEKKTIMKNDIDGEVTHDKVKAEIKREQVDEIIIPNIIDSNVILNEVDVEDIRNELYDNIDNSTWYDKEADEKFNNDGAVAGVKISLSYSAKYDNKDGVLVVELYNGTWSGTDENAYSTIKFYYDGGDYAGKKCSEIAKEHPDEVEDGDIYACSECKSYIKEAYKALTAVDDVDSDTYVPYINRVTDHWFRNVYFTEAGILNGDHIIETDYEYEKKTGERWTEYETYQDDNGKKQYELYIYKKQNGEYKTEFEDGVVCRNVGTGNGNYKLNDDGVTYVKSDGGAYKLFSKNSNGKITEFNGNGIDEFRVGKKAKTKEIEDGWIAYKAGEEKGEWEEMTVDENSPSSLKTIAKNENIKLIFKATYPTIVQENDGLRGETNSEIKKIFLDEYYLYDGNAPTAALIKEAKKMADSDDPDDFKSKYSNWKKKKITAKYDGEEYTTTIDQISGPINLTHNSLTAFSILENMHTLDAEYIYHDFKELIVELNYFDKEDLTEAEEEVMMFPVSGISGAGWPVVRYDKSEEFYGTLIHSATDLEARRAETEAELAELVGQNDSNEEPLNESNVSSNPSNSSVNESGGTTYSDNIFLQAAEDIHKYMEDNNYTYCVFGGNSYEECTNGSHGLEENFEKSKKGKKHACCATYVKWVCKAIGIEDISSDSANGLLDQCESSSYFEVINYSTGALQAGDIVHRDHHVQIFAGYDSSGNMTWYNAGSGDAIRKDSPYTSQSTSWDKIMRIKKWDGLEYNGSSGGSSSSSEQVEFAGYAGSTEDSPEYVVAPVTGEVIKYGTVKRKNIETGEDNEVGFIKIRVLGSEECKSGNKKGCTRFGGSHTDVSASAGKKYSKGKITATDWLEDNYSENKLKTLGYDYFWSEYNSAGIGDHIVYLEGFDVSDILGNDVNKKQNAGKNIEKLAKYIAKDETPNSYSTQYTVPNLLDDTREFELKIEEAAKEAAAYTITKNKKIYIKEGAVIGKTYSSDDENITKNTKLEVLKKNQDEDNEEIETKKKEYNIGNYMRIIFRDTDDEVVENVEDFVETENAEGSKTFAGDQEYQAQEGDLELLADAIHHEHCGAGHGANEEEHLYQSESMGFTILNKLSSDGKYWIDYSDPKYIWAPDKSKLYNLLCRQDQYKFYAIATEANCGDTLNLKERADQGKLNSCAICLEAAEFCLKNDSLNLANNGKFDTGYNKGEPMPHTCWEQGANWSGGKKWLYDGDYLFDTFDK